MVGVIGPPGVGKSTILNELYGFETSSPGNRAPSLEFSFFVGYLKGASSFAGMPLPFVVQSDESKAMARHCTMGMELRVSAERLILIDSQVILSKYVMFSTFFNFCYHFELDWWFFMYLLSLFDFGCSSALQL